MKRICMITNRAKDKDLLIHTRVREFLLSNSCEIEEIYLHWDSEVGNWSGIDIEDIKADCLLVLGGDGTMMQVARHFYGCGIPLLGINLGNLGFLTEIDSRNIEKPLSQLLQDEFYIEKRMLLEGTIQTKKECISGLALNDIVVNRAGALQIITFDVFLNEQLLKRYKADGCIVSTATGSTGYNLSAGGPVLDPTCEAIVMTNICPHDLFNRGVVLSSEKVVKIVIPKEGEKNWQIEASFDGCKTVKMEVGDSIEIRKAKEYVDIIRLQNTSFLEILHEKMG